jgi:hypothetical protein
MKYSIKDIVMLAVDYPRDPKQHSVIPQGSEGIVTSVLHLAKAYVVDFDDKLKHFVVPEVMLE